MSTVCHPGLLSMVPGRSTRISSHSRPDTTLAACLNASSPGEQRPRSARDDLLVRTLETREPEDLHVAGGWDRAEIGHEVVLDRRRKQRRQEDDVRDAPVDRGQSDIERFRDKNVFLRDLTAKGLTEDPGLNRVGLDNEKPRHDGSLPSCRVPGCVAAPGVG